MAAHEQFQLSASKTFVKRSSDRWNSPDDKVDDAEVEDLLIRVVVGDLLLLFLNLPHQLFSLFNQDSMRNKQMS